MTSSRETDESNAQDVVWIRLVCDGGRAGERAFESLFRKHYPPLLRFLSRQGAESADAEEIAQDTFMRMRKGACSFRSESRLSTWLFKIGVNRLLEIVRKPKPPIDVVVDPPEPEPTPPPRNGEELQTCFDNAFVQYAKKYPECAEVLRCVIEHQWSGRDVASFLGRTEGATREYLRQCRKRLKSFVEPCRQFLSED